MLVQAKSEYATVDKLLEYKLPPMPACVHVLNSAAHCPPLCIWDFVRIIRKHKERKRHAQLGYFEPATENSLNTVHCIIKIDLDPM